MEKIVKAYRFPEMERARLMVTQNQIQLNKFGINWLNSKYVQLSIKEDCKDPRLKMFFETIDHEYALDNCLNKLKYLTCLIPISITKYFAYKN